MPRYVDAYIYERILMEGYMTQKYQKLRAHSDEMSMKRGKNDSQDILHPYILALFFHVKERIQVRIGTSGFRVITGA